MSRDDMEIEAAAASLEDLARDLSAARSGRLIGFKMENDHKHRVHTIYAMYRRPGEDRGRQFPLSTFPTAQQADAVYRRMCVAAGFVSLGECGVTKGDEPTRGKGEGEEK
jgi:hypothetical protein